MAESFAEQLVEDMEVVFLNTAEFAETVSYTVSGGSAKNIPAVVERAPINPMEQAGRAYAALNTQIWISRDATVGIATVRERLDKVALKAKLTDAANTTFIVKRILDHDLGGWHLELEA